ncbi:DUF3710 domain-containing protein [Aeromicrobium camelliae]|uniref:DUF3710 domain-containing protein n=1 Tax=Aeromicrobium camelliae TaxID=1538144 RepID=A0A3N6WLQ7_9ACTN|nr:DUF3710 domain-containing protein [Aeromicrobium camelliae]RQN08496.1 DUF3710 domain-containing protein [Aeromicrobium camelliae]
MFGRRKKDAAAAEHTETPDVAAEVTVPATRSAGPWDSSERDPDGPGYVDLGALRIKGRDGVGLQLPTENGQLTSVLVVVEGSAMELRIFAASRSGGEWGDVLTDLKREVERREGDWKDADGPFGPELHFRVEVTAQDGRTGVQQSRILGVEGPRWLLRATLLGQAATDETAAEPLLEILRDVVVVRGSDPRMVREPLPLRMPPGVTPQSSQPSQEA